MRRRIITFTLLLLFVSGGSPLVEPTGRAAEPDFTGLDVLILIDQSGSMWGAGPRGTKNDKSDHRIGQAKNIIYRLAEHVEDTSFVHRVSVIDFGDNASTAFPAPLRLSFDPKDPGSTMREAKVMAERYITPKSLLNTNTPEAMSLGLKEFERMDGAEHLEGRRRVMLILTDGRPDLPNSGKTLDMLKEEASKAADALKSRDIGIWVVGLNDADNYWNEGDGEFWEKVTGKGRARLAETASTNISTVVQEIVNEWLGVVGTSIGSEYECPPYLSRIVFSINFGTPRSAVSVTDPDGNNVPLSSGGTSTVPGTFARFSVDDPVAGIYKINQDPSRSYTNFIEPFSANIKRISPVAKTSKDAEARLIFQATNSKDQPLELLPGWPIKASVLVTDASGSVTELPATFTGEGKFEAKWNPPALGVYRVKLKGLVTLKSGKQYDVFSSNAHSYDDRLEVDNSQPYWLRMTTPNPAQGVKVMPWAKSSTIEFSLLDSKKEVVANPGSVVKDAATWLSLQVVDKSGVALATPVPLTLTPSGSFVADIPWALDWKHGEGWWMSGQLNLRVLAQPNRLGQERFLDSIELPPEVEANRVGGDPLSVGAISLRYSWLLLVPLLLILLAIPLALVLWLFPNSLVWWADSSRKRIVELKIYDGNVDPSGDYAKRLPAGSWQSFKYDRQLVIPIDGQEVLAKTFRLKRGLSPDVVSAYLEYSWQGDTGATRRVLLTKGKAQRLKGLPSGDILVCLDSKP